MLYSTHTTQAQQGQAGNAWMLLGRVFSVERSFDHLQGPSIIKSQLIKNKIHSISLTTESSMCIPTGLFHYTLFNKQTLLALQLPNILLIPSHRSLGTCSFSVARTTGWQAKSASKGAFSCIRCKEILHF